MSTIVSAFLYVRSRLRTLSAEEYSKKRVLSSKRDDHERSRRGQFVTKNCYTPLGDFGGVLVESLVTKNCYNPRLHPREGSHGQLPGIRQRSKRATNLPKYQLHHLGPASDFLTIRTVFLSFPGPKIYWVKMRFDASQPVFDVVQKV